MADTCIIFSDPTSTTKIQIATRDGSQSTHSDWAGTMMFAQLKVTQSQDRNATASFVIHNYNTNDNIDSWMVPGIGVFVVHLGMLRFSGVITKVDGMYLTAGLQQRFTVSCESDSNYLMNYSPLSIGAAYSNTTTSTVIKNIIAPYTQWYDTTDPNNNISGAVNINYTISNKPMLTQIKEICTTTGYKYFCRTKSTYGTATIPGGGTAVTITGTTPDDFTTLSTGLAYGTHNKYILVLVARDGYFWHDSAAAVTATDNGTHIVTDTTTNAINHGRFNTGSTVLLIQQPIIYFQRDFNQMLSNHLHLGVNPTTNYYTTLAYGFNPLSEKNDVITKVTVTGVDNTGLPVSGAMAAAYPLNTTNNLFTGADGTARYLTFDELTSADSVDNTSKQNLAVWNDMGYTFAANQTYVICGYCQNTNKTFTWRTQYFTVNAGFPGATSTIDGRSVMYLPLSSGSWTYTFPKGSVVMRATDSMHGRVYVNASPSVSNDWGFLGRECVYYYGGTGSDSNGTYTEIFPANRGAQWSNGVYIVNTIAISHKTGCPILEKSYYDVDNVYSTSPMKKYGLINKNIQSNRTTDAGTLELLAYNSVRYLCTPREKGSVSTYISSLALSNVPASPGDTFDVTMYDGSTVKPSSGYYAIISIDMDFDQGTALVQFGQYNMELMRTLSLMGLDISIL